MLVVEVRFVLRSREMNDRVATTCHARSQVTRYQRTDGDLDARPRERLTAVAFHRIIDRAGGHDLEPRVARHYDQPGSDESSGACDQQPHDRLAWATSILDAQYRSRCRATAARRARIRLGGDEFIAQQLPHLLNRSRTGRLARADLGPPENHVGEARDHLVAADVGNLGEADVRPVDALRQGRLSRSEVENLPMQGAVISHQRLHARIAEPGRRGASRLRQECAKSSISPPGSGVPIGSPGRDFSPACAAARSSAAHASWRATV